MRTTLDLDDTLVADAVALSGISDRKRLLQEALRALIAREAGRQLAKTGGELRKAWAGRRRRGRTGLRTGGSR
jgi:Arc/MetJ family transcription regulator